MSPLLVGHDLLFFNQLLNCPRRSSTGLKKRPEWYETKDFVRLAARDGTVCPPAPRPDGPAWGPPGQSMSRWTRLHPEAQTKLLNQNTPKDVCAQSQCQLSAILTNPKVFM